MLKEISNSISIVGNISSLSDEKITANNKKYKTFDVCKNNKYINNKGEEIKTQEFFTFKIFENNLAQYESLLTVGKWVHILGFVHSYIDEQKMRKTYFVVNEIRDMEKQIKKDNIEIFDYDWLNDDEINSNEMEL